jgi:hypothetical protein
MQPCSLVHCTSSLAVRSSIARGTSPACYGKSWLFTEVDVVDDLYQLSKAFGNDKPEVLRRIELDLWRALLQVATGRDTIISDYEKVFCWSSTKRLASC